MGYLEINDKSHFCEICRATEECFDNIGQESGLKSLVRVFGMPVKYRHICHTCQKQFWSRAR